MMVFLYLQCYYKDDTIIFILSVIYNKWSLTSQEVLLNYADSPRLKENML